MVDLESITIDPSVLQLIPRTLGAELMILPLSVNNGTITVAVADSTPAEAIQDVAFLLGKKVQTETVDVEILRKTISKLYGVTGPEAEGPGIQESRGAETDGSAVGLVNRIISEAIKLGSSDIHIEPYERLFRVRYRIDGVLHEARRPSLQSVKTVISRLKIMADLDIAEKRRPQDGRIRIPHDGRTIDIRVSTLPTDFGEKVVLRILDKSQLKLDLETLGFETEDLKAFKRVLKLPFGMILVTGPTGSGKTTTLYAALNFINKPEVNITTIEDPIEYNLPGINQTHVRADIGLTFAAALRSILRQDPNVIMLGEIRDTETAEIAIRAALTGHLVFSTLHTNDASSAITRLVDMGVEPFLVASSVKMILAQRLLRKLCDKCKRPIEPRPEEYAAFNALRGRFYAGKGCDECNRLGYKGRTAVYEILPVTNGLSDLISKNAGPARIREHLDSQGFVTLRTAALKKAERGETSLDEVLRETA
ncbi:MAG: Flp pilus assembly complex ATPase component TadA [Ignavibacterium sp.]|jgi:type IV pilus assembly protein PilB